MRCFVAVLALVVAAQAGAQPFEGTAFMSPNVITPADPSTLVGIEYTGRGERLIFDRREGWTRAKRETDSLISRRACWQQSRNSPWP